MLTAGLNVCAGIDAGSSCSKIAYSDNLGTRIIAETEGFDAVALREEAEIFFDEPVFSCVIAVSDSLNSRQRDTLKRQAVNAGFRDVKIIGAFEAVSFWLGDEARTLVYDFGASRSSIFVIEGGEVLESVVLDDVCGDSFDRIFAEYLCERRLLKKENNELIREARRLKHVLSESTSRSWHNVNIYREDFERLIYFPVKRALHTVNRLRRVRKPERFVLTGGCAKIPLVREFLCDIFADADGIIAKGAAMRALELTKQTQQQARKNLSDTASRMREIRTEILRIEDKLTRQQKDRLYVLFKQAEGINDSGAVTLMENLISEIRNI